MERLYNGRTGATHDLDEENGLLGLQMSVRGSLG
jgi:hypothetical protein